MLKVRISFLFLNSNCLLIDHIYKIKEKDVSINNLNKKFFFSIIKTGYDKIDFLLFLYEEKEDENNVNTEINDEKIIRWIMLSNNKKRPFD